MLKKVFNIDRRLDVHKFHRFDSSPGVSPETGNNYEHLTSAEKGPVATYEITRTVPALAKEFVYQAVAVCGENRIQTSSIRFSPFPLSRE